MTFKMKEPIYENNFATLTLEFYKNNHVFHGIIFVEKSPNLILDTVCL